MRGAVASLVSWFGRQHGIVSTRAVEFSTAPPPKVCNIVLVHGAFTDGSCWIEVIELLNAKGYRVTSVQDPLTSLTADIAATERALEMQTGEVLLVGHSWAGVVISVAGNANNVRGLVYLSAIAPDNGESAFELLEKLRAPMRGLTPDENG
ncbi:alpha/beta fold hydrolase [Paraburkholderia tropica]|nr:alpha/beta hydrolase [Paraburkholderia tropica]